MPRTPEASAAVRRATRDRIRRAAVLLMAEQGYHATTLRQIAARAGVAGGLPSHYFGSKDALLVEIADRWRERTRAALAAHEDSDPATALRLLVRSALLGLDTSPDEVTESRAVSALLADPQARQVLRAAQADAKSADLFDTLDRSLREAGSTDPAGDRLLILAAVRGALSLAAEDPAFPLRDVEEVLLARVLGR
ncbi:TetR/AcrR family transcriptional regulator [Streptomyces indicus]|uniref:DNA-binding transcriptional regulator, AcrR family n=1 Tax=Streptomyces indicus TaxID=417292 RepID=A0A1G8U2V2_9ACTN|nr:TetR/AcrR family transcriptional regulator [Streptomyces indicus]SDJ48156.1 DNA-binding transcriptional regulator, AcrR family [Streptomyces indicus]